MMNYVSYFLTPALAWSAALTVLVAAGTAWVVRRRHGSVTRQVLSFAVVSSLGLILYATLLREPPGGFCWECLTEPAAWGDWGLHRLTDGRLNTEVRLNVALFVPLGLTATLLWKAPFRVTGAAALLSVAIEFVQPLTGVGANDIVDITANSLGAFLGSGIATLCNLIQHTTDTRKFDGRRWTKFALTIAITLAATVGGSTWGASSRQLAGAQQLQEMFAGTTFADYQNHDSWWPRREAFWRANGMPFSDSYVNETIALQRYTWDFYLSTRCVIAAWDHDGFSTVLRAGTVCSSSTRLTSAILG